MSMSVKELGESSLREKVRDVVWQAGDEQTYLFKMIAAVVVDQCQCRPPNINDGDKEGHKDSKEDERRGSR